MTIGTLDGANVEMAEEMGNDNIFIFGMTVPEVEALKVAGYNAMDYVEKNPELAKVMEQLSDGTFSKTGNAEEFKDLKNNLVYHDRYLTFADYDSYIAAQDKVNETYRVRINFSRFFFFKIFFQNFFKLYRTKENGPKWPFSMWRLPENSVLTELSPNTDGKFGESNPHSKLCLSLEKFEFLVLMTQMMQF